MRRIAAALACLLLATVTHAAGEAGWERVFPSLDDVRAVLIAAGGQSPALPFTRASIAREMATLETNHFCLRHAIF